MHDDGTIGPPLPRPAGPHCGASTHEPPAGARPCIDDCFAGCFADWGLGAAARRGDDLDRLAALGRKLNNHCHSIGIALGACTVPAENCGRNTTNSETSIMGSNTSIIGKP